MIVPLKIELKIANDLANNLIVGVATAIKNLKFALKNGEQPLNAAVVPV